MWKKLNPLILFTGPEGSGKTTLALNLKSLLERRGYRVRIVRIRGTHTLAFLLAMFLKRVLKLHGDYLHYYKVYIPRPLKRFWLLTEFVSVIPLILLYYHFYRIRGAVISERSLIDFIVWVTGGLNINTSFVRSFVFRLMLVFALRYKPIYVTAYIDDLIKRKPFEKELILKLSPHYELFRRTLNLIAINTSEYSLDYCLKYLCASLDLMV